MTQWGQLGGKGPTWGCGANSGLKGANSGLKGANLGFKAAILGLKGANLEFMAAFSGLKGANMWLKGANRGSQLWAERGQFRCSKRSTLGSKGSTWGSV